MGTKKGIPSKRKGLTKFQRLALRELVNFTCEECHKKEDGWILETHRMNQKLRYIPRNIKMLCSDCHEEFSAAQRIAGGTQ